MRGGLWAEGGRAIREEGAGITRCIAEWSEKCEGEVKVEHAGGLRLRGEGGGVSQWSRQPPLRGKVGRGGGVVGGGIRVGR